MNIRTDKAVAALKAVGRRAGLIAAVLVSIALGFLLHAAVAPEAGKAPASADAAGGDTEWTCSMHPQVRGEEGDLCPICGMDLVPVDDSGAARRPRELATTDAAKALMDIETAPVERKFVAAEVRMVGKIDYDETRLASIAARVPGRLDRLFVDYTGVRVREGDHLVSIYSPELLAAQEELIQAKQAVREMEGSSSTLLRETTEATYQAAREKLRLLGLTAEQVAEIERTGVTSDHLTIYSPIGGIVIDKRAEEGDYVDTGTRIYTVADLSRMWVRLEAYESDLMWIRYGQTVEFTTVAYPGEFFEGTISFIDPVLDPATRTVKVRVNVPNPDGKLKPGMFVRASVRSRIAAGGRVMDADLAGKWISPMHPEIVKDEPGACDVCGMPLVRTESLGYVSIDPEKADRPLVIPSTAALITGTSAVVYVEVPDADAPTYEGRRIALGPRAADHYLVESGLLEGERVVTRGAFKIDSALQIQARPSMMSPEDDAEPAGPDPAEPVVNVRCPIMGSAIDPFNVADDLVRVWRGRRVGFCCAGCPEMWDELDEAEKESKLADALPGGETPEDE